MAFINIQIPLLLGSLVNVLAKHVSDRTTEFVSDVKQPALHLVQMYFLQVLHYLLYRCMDYRYYITACLAIWRTESYRYYYMAYRKLQILHNILYKCMAHMYYITTCADFCLTDITIHLIQIYS